MTSVRTRGTRRSALVGAVLALLGALVVSPGTAQAATTTYAADNSIFPNPERGFHHRVDIMALSAADDVQSARSTNSITLLHTYLRSTPAGMACENVHETSSVGITTTSPRSPTSHLSSSASMNGSIAPDGIEITAMGHGVPASNRAARCSASPATDSRTPDIAARCGGGLLV